MITIKLCGHKYSYDPDPDPKRDFLGKGAFASVYKATQEGGQVVAIKIFHSTPEQLDKEIDSLKGIVHPNIVQLLAFGTGDKNGENVTCLVMNYIAGKTLDEYCKEKKAMRSRPDQDSVLPKDPVSAVVGVMSKILSVMEFVHQKDTIHRDLKPGNILVDDNGQPHILDFGIARRFAEDKNTQRLTSLGTPIYMPPELIEIEADTETSAMANVNQAKQCDVWSLGVILYEMVTGNLPFQGKGQFQIMNAICRAEPMPMQDVDGELEAICLKALKKERSQRYQSVRDFNEDVKKYLATLTDRLHKEFAEKLKARYTQEIEVKTLDESEYQSPVWPCLQERMSRLWKFQAPVIPIHLLTAGDEVCPEKAFVGYPRPSGSSLQAIAQSQLVILAQKVMNALSQAEKLALKPEIPGKECLYINQDEVWIMPIQPLNLTRSWPCREGESTGLQFARLLTACMDKQQTSAGVAHILGLPYQKESVEDVYKAFQKGSELHFDRNGLENKLKNGPEPEAIEAVRVILKALACDSEIVRLLALQLKPMLEGKSKTPAIVEMATGTNPRPGQEIAHWSQANRDNKNQEIWVFRSKYSKLPPSQPTVMVEIFGLPQKLWDSSRHDHKGAWILDMSTDLWCEFTVEEQQKYAAMYQQGYAAANKLDVEKTITKSGTSFTFRLIPPGRFWMGSLEKDIEKWKKDYSWVKAETRHRVVISKAYYLAQTEVTQGQWQAVMGNNPSYFQKAGSNAPVESVSWNDCQGFFGKTGFQFPTEAQWEYACRSGVTREYYWGDEIDGNYCWYISNSGHSTHPVKEKSPNAWELYDMSGNVWEWCKDSGDWSGKVITDTYIEGAVDSVNTKGSRRLDRGGGWCDFPVYCRSASRDCYSPDYRSGLLGFRPLGYP